MPMFPSELPFPRGSTFYAGRTPDGNAYEGIQLEGQEYWCQDLDFTNASGGMVLQRSKKPVKVKVVRNVSGVTLTRKLLVKYKTTHVGRRVDGYATGQAAAPGNDKGWPVDEFLPSGGVVNGDLFYIVVQGPAMTKTALDAVEGNVINQGERVMVQATAAGTTGTTAGRISQAILINHTDLDATSFEQNARQLSLNVLGVAMTAATTSNTDTDILVDVGQF